MRFFLWILSGANNIRLKFKIYTDVTKSVYSRQTIYGAQYQKFMTVYIYQIKTNGSL